MQLGLRFRGRGILHPRSALAARREDHGVPRVADEGGDVEERSGEAEDILRLEQGGQRFFMQIPLQRRFCTNFAF